MASLICSKRKWIFVHPPRTGGTSVARAIGPIFSGPPVPKHFRLWEMDVEPSEFFKFMTVRNPWVRVASTIAWYEAHKVPGGIERAVCYSLPLEEFGLPKMDFVLRCEQLQQDFSALCVRLGIVEPRLGRYSHYARKPYREYFDEHWRDVVAKRYADEINRFGYEF